MTKRLIAALAMLVIQFFAVRTARAQQDTSALAQLQRQVEALTREIEAMRLGEDVVVRADTGAYGLGPAASKVYGARSGVSLGGYGETLLQHTAAETMIDALRLVLYLGYKFTPKIVFNSEIEFEHAATALGGAIAVEMAYIDYVASPHFGIRAGMVLLPVGLINEVHEPPAFLGTRRPLTETYIIPSTWRENGAGIFGELNGLTYRAYVINGLNAAGGRFAGGKGFSAHEGLRGARQSGSVALLKHPAVVARVDYSRPSLPGLMVGGSVYTGGTLQTSDAFNAATSVFEGHAQYRGRGFDLRALFVAANVGDAAKLNQMLGYTGNQSVGEELHGWYAQAGYDILRSSGAQQLIPYVRFESLNTQASVPAGFTAAPQNDRTVTTLGAMWKPITHIAVAADYQIHDNKAGTGVNQLNVSLGYLF